MKGNGQIIIRIVEEEEMHGLGGHTMRRKSILKAQWRMFDGLRHNQHLIVAIMIFMLIFSRGIPQM